MGVTLLGKPDVTRDPTHTTRITQPNATYCSGAQALTHDPIHTTQHDLLLVLTRRERARATRCDSLVAHDVRRALVSRSFNEDVLVCDLLIQQLHNTIHMEFHLPLTRNAPLQVVVVSQHFSALTILSNTQAD